MNAIVYLMLLLGGFLIMDAVGEKRVVRAKRESKKSVKYVPLSIYDEQLSGRSMRDEFRDMFYSDGPWAYRHDLYWDSVRAEDDEVFDMMFAQLMKDRGDLTSKEAAEERARVEERLRKWFEKQKQDRMLMKAGINPEDSRFENFAPYRAKESPSGRIKARQERRRKRQTSKQHATADDGKSKN